MHHHEIFQDLLESSEDIVIAIHPDVNILYASPSVSRIFDFKPDELKGKSVVPVLERRKINGWRRALKDPSQGNIHELITLSGINGQRLHFEVEVSRFFQDSEGIVVRMHDVSRQKAREKELLRSNHQKDQLIYKTTHDLKAPISSALGLINLADKADGEEKTKYFSLVKRSLLRLDSYIDEMNNIFRIEKLAVQREQLSMATLLREELDNLQSLYEQPRISIEIEVKGHYEFYSDSMRVRTIVGNLLSNAIKYSDPGKNEPFIKIYVSITEEFCDLRIVDNGIGIAGEYHQKIFDLFFRATDRSKGTGLGLSIVKDTVERLKGKIEVHSILGQGTTFTLRLPNSISQPFEVE